VRLLHLDPRPGRVDLGRGKARQQVPLLDEPGVGAELGPLPEVELARPAPEADRRRRPALHPHDSGRTARRALAEHALLDQDDVLEPGPAQEVRTPGAYGSAAHHDGVGGFRQLTSHRHASMLDID
jgi:hypothetical protein